MSTKNRYYRRSRISEREFRQIIRYFALDLSASDTARLTTISVRSVNAIYIKLRRRLAGECEPQVSMTGQVEVDESYFGRKRIRGKRGRGAGSKTIVFGLFKRNGRVHTEIVPDARKATLQAVIRGKVGIERGHANLALVWGQMRGKAQTVNSPAYFVALYDLPTNYSWRMKNEILYFSVIRRFVENEGIPRKTEFQISQ